MVDASGYAISNQAYKIAIVQLGIIFIASYFNATEATIVVLVGIMFKRLR